MLKKGNQLIFILALVGVLLIAGCQQYLKQPVGAEIESTAMQISPSMDTDGDGDIDYDDFFLFVNYVGTSEERGPNRVGFKYDAALDFNDDGKIDDTDVTLFQQNFGKTIPTKQNVGRGEHFLNIKELINVGRQSITLEEISPSGDIYLSISRILIKKGEKLTIGELRITNKEQIYEGKASSSNAAIVLIESEAYQRSIEKSIEVSQTDKIIQLVLGKAVYLRNPYDSKVYAFTLESFDPDSWRYRSIINVTINMQVIDASGNSSLFKIGPLKEGIHEDIEVIKVDQTLVRFRHDNFLFSQEAGLPGLNQYVGEKIWIGFTPTPMRQGTEGYYYEGEIICNNGGGEGFGTHFFTCKTREEWLQKYSTFCGDQGIRYFVLTNQCPE